MADENQENGLHFDLPPNRSSVIKVIGVGGGGSNAVNHMKAMGIKGVDFMVCNTDAQALEHSKVENRIQLGVQLTEGLGAGANPSVGRDAATESLKEIREVLDHNTRMVFITAGMGGGTGTGAAPVIAKLAREMNILTVGIVTKPFHFEGKRRASQADDGIEELRQHVDSLVVINNDKLREVYGNLGFRSGFAKADEVLATAAKGIAEVITYHYTTNIDLRDVKTVLENSGTAIMGSASAKGTDRAKHVVSQALDSPLLNDNHINGSKNVLLLIVSGSGDHEITMDEMSYINEYIQDEAGGNTNVIMGIGIDDTLDETISVTVIATGFPPKQGDAIVGRTPQKIVHPLDEDQPIEKGVFEKPFADVESPDRPIRTKPAQPDLFSEVTPPAKPVVHDLYEEEENDLELVNETDQPLKTTETTVEDEVVAETAEATTSEIDTEIEDFEAELDEEFEMADEADEELEEDEAVTFDADEDNATVVFEMEDEDEFALEESPADEALEELKAELDEHETTLEQDEETVAEEEDMTFELDDIEGDGIALIVKEEVAAEAQNEDTDYDPFDFSIDEVMGTKQEEKPAEAAAENQISEIVHMVSEAKKPDVVKHTLEDYRDLEERLKIKKPVQDEPAPLAAEKPSAVKVEEEEELLQFKVKEVPSENKQEQIVEEEDILNRPIGPASRKKILERKQRLEQFSYKFRPKMTEVLEKEPAYKRQGLDLGARDYSSTSNVSKMTISGEGEETEIKTNNSFLHDNVD